MIEFKIRRQIQEELSALEEREGVSIFYACESGSRAWEFESQDSHYDVRFLYIHPTDDFACMWIEQDLGLVPTEFSILVDKIVQDSKLQNAIAELLVRKKAGLELDRGPEIPVISDFIDHQLARFSTDIEGPAVTRDPARLNEIFRQALQLTWGRNRGSRI